MIKAGASLLFFEAPAGGWGVVGIAAALEHGGLVGGAPCKAPPAKRPRCGDKRSTCGGGCAPQVRSVGTKSNEYAPESL